MTIPNSKLQTPKRVLLAGFLAAVGVFTASGGVVTRAQQPSEIVLGREWLDAVRTHKPGTNDEPAARLATWSSQDLERALTFFDSLTEAEVNGLAVRAATLHSDVAIWQWDALQGLVRAPPSTGTRSGGPPVVIVVDGRYVGTESMTVHWSFARRLVERVRPTPKGDQLARLWYRATVAYLIGTTSFTEGLPHVARARQLFPDEAFFAFAGGCASETLASRRIQQAARQMASTRAGRANVGTAESQLADAAGSFRTALKLDPSMTEARVRLGRVLALRRNRGALRELEAALAAASDPTLRYYTLLFVAERREAARQFGAAREAYEAASRLFPAAQTPLIALSHLARRTGDRAGARRAVARLAALPPRADDRHDPWWLYDVGPGRDTERLLAELQAALRDSAR